MDPNREKTSKAKQERKPGGQIGHIGCTLQQVDNPDAVIEIKVNRSNLPLGRWKHSGYEKRQVIDLKITKQVTE
jgi:transposase